MPEKTMQSAILGGDEVYGIRQLDETSVEVTFDNENRATIDTLTFRFAGEANERLLELVDENKNEGPELVPLVTDGVISYAEKYWVVLDESFRHISDVETECTLRQDNGVLTFLEQGKGLIIELLKQEGLWTEADAVDIPYIVENRKRLLEFLTMQITLLQLSKAIYDEVFKLVNIVSDIASGLWVTTVAAGITALVNLTQTIINLVLLTIQLVKLMLDMQKALFPPTRYHKGMNLWNWLVKGANRLGHDIEFGDEFAETLKKVNLCPSKNDEVGPPRST